MYARFMLLTVTKVRQVGKPGTADRLEQNKEKFKQFLIKNNWKKADMTNREWRKDSWKKR